MAGAMALAVAGCGPSAARLQCLDSCQGNNDACVAHATSDSAVAACSAGTSACVGRCPP